MAVDTLEKTNTKTKNKTNLDAKLPNLYSVVLFNDDKTPMMYVVELLISIFNYKITDAIAITDKIDKDGSAVVISGLVKELAVHLRDLVLVDAKANNYPLQAEIQAQ